MSETIPPAPQAPDDEATKRALEIHERLMREHRLDYHNIGGPADPPAPPAPKK